MFRWVVFMCNKWTEEQTNCPSLEGTRKAGMIKYEISFVNISSAQANDCLGQTVTRNNCWDLLAAQMKIQISQQTTICHVLDDWKQNVEEKTDWSIGHGIIQPPCNLMRRDHLVGNQSQPRWQKLYQGFIWVKAQYVTLYTLLRPHKTGTDILNFQNKINITLTTLSTRDLKIQVSQEIEC